ncbi:MAG: aminoacyl-tRNA hydrolase [Candidatus Berkelbacteria bacterium]|nr:aminoacyl-tRNA hydrolase [Candidatus Berkelbacteria bacterium]
MKIIFGLGNPGEKYVGTRHNVGFDFVDLLAKHPRLNLVGEMLKFNSSKKFKAEIAETQISGDKILLVKPLTFMNLSGDAVRKIVDFYGIDIADILIVSDDLDLPVGMSRIRLSGSSGGHKGLDSIITSLGEDNFTRLRIGISDKKIAGVESSHPYEKPEAKEFVLGIFSKRARPIIDKMLEKDVDEIIRNFIEENKLVGTTIEI